MTKEQRELLKEMGPYTLSEEGIVHDREGVSLAFSMRTHPTSEECEWDLAVVAALNEVVAVNAAAQCSCEEIGQSTTWHEGTHSVKYRLNVRCPKHGKQGTQNETKGT